MFLVRICIIDHNESLHGQPNREYQEKNTFNLMTAKSAAPSARTRAEDGRHIWAIAK